MAKQPYIPLYIGDWEQDTNCLSLQAEAAWLKIIFKMFKGDKSGVYKIYTKALQNLWKCDTKEVQNILFELHENSIGDIKIDEPVVFINRRMQRDAEISVIRTKAVQNRYKTSTKDVQNTEYEYEYEDEYIIGNINKETKENFSFKNELLKKGFQENLVVDWIKVRKTKKATNTETALNAFLIEVQKTTLEQNEVLKLCIEKSWSGFKSEWWENEKNKISINGNGKQPNHGQSAGAIRLIHEAKDEWDRLNKI